MTPANLKRAALALVASGLASVAVVAQLVSDRTGVPVEQVAVALQGALGRDGRDPATLRTRYVSVYATNANLAAAADELAAGYCHALTLDPALAAEHAACVVSQRLGLTQGRPVCNLTDTTVRGRAAVGLRLTEWQFDRLVEQRATPVTALVHDPDVPEAIVEVEAALAAASRRWCPEAP